MKFTKQDYQNVLKVWPEWDKVYMDYPSFDLYCTSKIKELQKPQLPVYRCIQLPSRNNGNFELGKLYNTDWYCCGFSLPDLPFHFELTEPEPEPEKITMLDISNMLEIGFANHSIGREGIKIIDRIKKDHLS